MRVVPGTGSVYLSKKQTVGLGRIGGVFWERTDGVFRGAVRWIRWVVAAPCSWSVPLQARLRVASRPVPGTGEVVECLLAQGVDVYAKNNRGHTPIVLCTVSEATATRAHGVQAAARVWD